VRPGERQIDGAFNPRKHDRDFQEIHLFWFEIVIIFAGKLLLRF